MIICSHVSKKSNRLKSKPRQMCDAIKQDTTFLRSFEKKVGAQIFVTGPQSVKETLKPEEKEKIRDLVIAEEIALVIHGSYIDHGCWNEKPISIHCIKEEMKIAAKICATGTIVHLGAGAAVESKLKYVIDGVGTLEAEVKAATTLWLEINSAKSSDATFETPQKLHKLFDMIRKINVHDLKIGLCIDTAHLFACGTNLDTRQSAKDWLTVFKNLEPDLPLMFHLNDCSTALGCGKDIHAPLTMGNIWSAYNPSTGKLPIEDSGLMEILEFCNKNSLMVILERDDNDLTKDLSLLNKLGF